MGQEAILARADLLTSMGHCAHYPTQFSSWGVFTCARALLPLDRILTKALRTAVMAMNRPHKIRMKQIAPNPAKLIEYAAHNCLSVALLASISQVTLSPTGALTLESFTPEFNLCNRKGNRTDDCFPGRLRVKAASQTNTHHWARGFANDAVGIGSETPQGFFYSATADDDEVGAVTQGCPSHPLSHVSCFETQLSVRASCTLEFVNFLMGRVIKKLGSSQHVKAQFGCCFERGDRMHQPKLSAEVFRNRRC